MLRKSFALSLAERLDPPDPEVFRKLEYVPTPRQQEFHEATEFAVLYGGAVGGGKTKALVAEGIKQCVLHPGLRVGAFRRSYPELKESMLAELAQMDFAKAVGASWNGTEYDLKFPNGSIIMFRYAENVQDATKRQGGQYQLLLFDERTLTPPEVCVFLESRLRSGRADVPVIGVRSGTNPGGVGHGDVKMKYIDATDNGKKIVLDARRRTVRFIPSKLSDNPHVNPEYADDLRGLPEHLRRAFLDGDWNMFAGQVFSEWGTGERFTVRPMSIPETWKRYQGVDWGYTAPWAVVWGAIDEDGRAWIYRELYARQVGEAEQARQILAAEAGEPISERFADDAMWATRGDAKPISEVYADNGVYLSKAGKGGGSRVNGWQRIHSYLTDAPACPHHRAMGWKTCPNLHVFDTCANFLRTIPALPHAKTGDPEDVDTNADDHIADALRYMLVNMGSGPEFMMVDSAVNAVVDSIPAAQPIGPFAYVPRDDDNPYTYDDYGGEVNMPWGFGGGFSAGNQW